MNRKKRLLPPGMDEPKLTLTAGAEILGPGFRLVVVAVEFQRSGYFPDAVAQVISDVHQPGTHINTPWGYVMVVEHNPVNRPLHVAHPPA